MPHLQVLEVSEKDIPWVGLLMAELDIKDNSYDKKMSRYKMEIDSVT